MYSQIIRMQEKYYKMIFQPEHAEDITNVYLLNQHLSLFLTYSWKKYQKKIGPYGIVFVWGWVYVCVLPIFPRTFIWQQTDTLRTLHLPRTYTCVLAKHWLKSPKTSCFTILGGSALWGLQWTSYITIYEDTRVLGSISYSQWVHFFLFYW